MPNSPAPRASWDVIPSADFVTRANSAPTSLAGIERLSALLDRCMCELLAAYGFSAICAEQDEQRVDNAACLAAFIGFGGDRLRGSLTAIAPKPLLDRTHPLGPPSVSLSEADAADWCCELVNQLSGRLKNKLLPYGVSFQLSTPQGLLADRIRLTQPAHGGHIVRSYCVDGFELRVCLDVIVTPGEILFRDDEPVGEAAPVEGDITLF